MFFHIGALLAFGAFHIPVARCQGNITAELGARLSEGASVTTNTSSAPRWSEYGAPQAGYIVHVAEELDVAETVRYCNENGIQFLAQSGGNGWANTFNMSRGDLIINLRGLNSVVVNENRDRVHIGGGVLNEELIEAAYENEVQVLNGGCNCVGVMGSTLGGGVSRFMNRYGLPADNVVCANLVTGEGEMIEVSETSHPDLLWAIRGAGANFGIVTSVVMNAYPTIDNGQVWAGELFFTGDQLEPYVEAVNNLNLTEDMTIHWGFNLQPPNNTPAITAEIFFMSGDAEAGKRAFQPLYDLGPYNDTTTVMAYNRLNDDTLEFCEDGGRKPGWHVGLQTLDYAAFQAVWDEWVDFVGSTGLNNTGVLVECYSNYVVRQIGSESASYAHRDINFYAMTIPIYEDVSLDGVVEEYATTVRDLWRNSSGFEQPRAYMNFAHGDESLEEIYGESLPRLRELKQQWDPEGRFNQFFPIS
ncbi:MAG: hypothetical protein M1837_003401 [Sclerophora amabilis]|nr:MAG: hypothetical protein M1837_003401 [Sclerophora amabilis]